MVGRNQDRLKAIEEGRKYYVGRSHTCGCVIKFVSSQGCHFCGMQKGRQKLAEGVCDKYHTPENTRRRLRNWRKNNKEKYEGQWLRSCIKRIGVNLTEDRYWEMVENQNGLCLICNKPDDKGRLCIDHCHTTNKVRGLLCRNCNLALGNLKDDPLLFERCVLYLKGNL